MRQYFLRRLLLAIPTLFGVTVLIFFVMRILPGDPLSVIVSEDAGTYVLTDEELAAVRADLGLDKALYLQYADWMIAIGKGDLGHSFWNEKPVSHLIKRRGPISAQIALMSVIISWLVGLPVGILGAVKRNTWWDHISRFFVTLFMAIPAFWVGLMAVLISVIVWTYRPPLSIYYLWTDPWLKLQLTIGPSIVMGLGLGAAIARMARSSILETYREDYVRTARAKGLEEGPIIWRHVIRNALLPVITISALQMAALLGGAVAVERAFAVPGLGLSLVQAITERDWMIIQNLVLIFGVTFVTINLIVDLIYGWIDPRIRYG